MCIKGSNAPLVRYGCEKLLWGFIQKGRVFWVPFQFSDIQFSKDQFTVCAYHMTKEQAITDGITLGLEHSSVD